MIEWEFDRMEGGMKEKRQEKRNEVLTISEYLAKRKGKQSIDQNWTECYDTWMKRILFTKEIERWHY